MSGNISWRKDRMAPPARDHFMAGKVHCASSIQGYTNYSSVSAEG
jgi:hypothetical protein